MRALLISATLLLTTAGLAMAQGCADLVPDPYALDRLSGAQASARLVADPGPAIAACEEAYQTDATAGIGIRLAFALAASQEREGEARALLAGDALSDSPEAINMLGALYGNGIGGPVDQETAQALFERASDLGFAIGAYNLGEMLFHGTAGRIDKYRARDLLEVAATADVPEAQALLGLLLSAARVGKPDPVRGISLIHDALDANAVNALTYASRGYEGIVGTVERLDDSIHRYAVTAEDAGNRWKEYLIASGEAGDRTQMILSALVQSYGDFRPELKQMFLKAIEQPRKEDRLHIWVRFASTTIDDGDETVYRSVYNGWDGYVDNLQVDPAPILAELEGRLGFD